MSYTEDSSMTQRAWFRPLVGLWFAFLLGAGTLGVLYVMAPATRDYYFARTGLAGLHPYFEAPVGMAGFAAAAAVAALVGLVLGMIIAARLAKRDDADLEEGWADEDAREEVVEDEPARNRVLSARDDIDEDGIAITETAEFVEIDEPVETEVEVLEEDAHIDAPQEEDAPTPAPVRAAEDLSLDQLTARLATALEAHKAAEAAPSRDEDTEQVISFLRREAEREGGESVQDPQAALRSALDKLGRVGRTD
ncbi:hypothetical protein [Qipengyuania nanhaisediminis]|uniref:Uncharacterized protein n=1 Tax=Qipengyuania nanhaisediminis TaxID=604088 RepID=A0A1I5KNB0_9SPHN|nr:hypothetical protein [Qipengyuania nanhaisediminis]SFO86397.1 hypothetical protein SAMN04488060_0387 [Qipengyuania nanhaisediminis]